MLQDYIKRRLLAKNRSIYFKKGKWVFHVFCMLIFWLISYQEVSGAGFISGTSPARPGLAVLAALLSMAPFFLFFYCYCLYLIPVCFKQRRYKMFWVILASMIIVVPWIEEGINVMLRHSGFGTVPARSPTGWRYIYKLYREFITAFLGFTTILFLMELVEGIRTVRDTRLHNEDLERTELQLLKTRMNPEFINRSLDDIVALSESRSAGAPDAVIQFSDVLRYRLYRSNRGLVRLDEELQQLGNLFRLQHSMPVGAATLEVEGRNPDAVLTPMVLLNIAEQLLTTYQEEDEWSLLFYVLIEATELQIAVELNTRNQTLAASRLRTIREETSRISGREPNFAIEHTQNNYSIRICLPIQNSSTVSS